MSAEQQLQMFNNLLSHSQFDLSLAQPDIDKAFLAVISKYQVKNSTQEAVGELVTKKKNKKSGYTLFLSEKMGVEKMKMAEAVAAWKGLAQEEKDKWNSKVPKEEVVVVKKKKNKKSGYSIFLSENMGKDKMNMAEAAIAWKGLSQEEKDKWNSKVPQEVIVEKKKNKKSGYSVFLSENMGKEKMNMVEAAAIWKSLTEDKKNEWKAKATEL